MICFTPQHLSVVLSLFLVLALDAAEPLRVMVRTGQPADPEAVKLVELLNQRGMKTEAVDHHTRFVLSEIDVLIGLGAESLHLSADADQQELEAFVKRGGGVLALGRAMMAADRLKPIIGGVWRPEQSKELAGPMHLYFTDRENPVTAEVSNWAMDGTIFYDLDLDPQARILAAAYTPKPSGARSEQHAQRAKELTEGGRQVSVYDVQPQMWLYEGEGGHRAFVALTESKNSLERSAWRVLLLRGIAWAGRCDDVDQFCQKEELGDALRYVEGGPTRPDQAHELLEVHPDFEIRLVAAEPLIHKPMNIDWDAKGRLWVCETPEYPNGRRKPNVEPWKDTGSASLKIDREPLDRISILTDSNGDGVMDHRHVFADKLELVTSFCFYRNGVIACAAPDIWFLEDTNGDEVADRRTKLYTGLGSFDTHAVINNLRWGPDGWIYATHGYSGGDVTALGKPDVKPLRISSGVVRFKPDGSEIEMFSSKGGNTWGLDITTAGEVFWTQPTSGTVFFHTVLPEWVLAKGKLPGVNSWHGMITGQKSFPLLNWPEQAYVQIDQVGQFTAAAGCAIYEGGAWPEKWNRSYFTAEPTINIVHHQFVEPDGVTFRTFKEPGREQTEFIRSRDLWFRPIETRVGPDGALYLVDFYNQAVIHNDTRGPAHGPANAAVRPDRDHYFGRIWRVQHRQAKPIETPDLSQMDRDELLQVAQNHNNSHTRKTAVRLLLESDETPTVSTAHLPSSPMRYFELAASASTPDQRAKVLQQFLAANNDWSRSAIIAGASDRAVDYLESCLAAEPDSGLDTLASALLPAALSQEDAAAQLVILFAGDEGRNLALVSTLLNGMDRAQPKVGPELTAALRRLIARPSLTAAALPLAARWDSSGDLAGTISELQERLKSEFVSLETHISRRLELARTLIRLGGATRDTATAVLFEAGTPAALGGAIIHALDREGQMTSLVQFYDKLPFKFATPALDAILKHPDASRALLKALADGHVKVTSLGPSNLARLRNHPDAEVAKAAKTLLDQLSPQNPEKDQLIAQLTPEVIKPGDAARGKLLFSAACAVCHRYGDVGTRDVGPPLLGMGAHGPAALLVHVVDPNREVDPSFWQWNLTKTSGEVLAGIITSENVGSVTLRNQAGDFEVRVSEIAKKENTRRSLMPEGLEALGAEALRDILTFMSAAEPKTGGPNDRELAPAKPVVWEPNKKRILIVTGGSSHDFPKFFGEMDSAILSEAGFTVHYTEDRDQAAEALAEADVAIVSVNRMFFDTPAYRKAFMAFVERGGGVIMMHPGTWYAYPNWPQLNAQIVGGGSRGHDKIKAFDVKRTREHPVMEGVPEKFTLEDELYHVNPDPAKLPPETAEIEVLAETSPSEKYKKSHPAVWITQHPKARIVCISIGHDERTHDHPAFKTLLQNAAKWVSEQ